MADMNSGLSYRVVAGPSTSSFAWKDEQSNTHGNDTYYPKDLDGLSRHLKALYLSKELTDATIKADDAEFFVHRVILAAQSPTFLAMFKKNLAKNNVIVDITGCTKEVCEDFILYLYTSRVGELNTLKVLGLYTLASKFNVDELKKICLQFMLQEMSVDKFCHFADLAILHKEPLLLDICTKFFIKNAVRITKSHQWLPFVKMHTEAAIEFYKEALG